MKLFTKLLIMTVLTIAFISNAIAQCTPQSVYAGSFMEDPNNPGVNYTGFVCNDVPNLNSRFPYWDGDAYWVNLIQGATYDISILNATTATSITMVDSSATGAGTGNIIPGAFVSANMPTNTLAFTAPYTGRYYISVDIDGDCANAGNADIGDFSVALTSSTACPIIQYEPCAPASVYANSIMEDPNNPGVDYKFYVCDDVPLVVSSFPYWDGDGYWVKLLAGASYTVSISNATTPTSITIVDSSAVGGNTGNLIPGAFATGTSPNNSLTFTAPYTGQYFVTFDIDGDCTNAGNADIGDVSVQLNGSAVCPAPPVYEPCTPVNIYANSIMEDPNNAGVDYQWYVCDDVPLINSSFAYWDGDGYWVRLIAGASYTVSINSATLPTSITIVDSTAMGNNTGNLISGAFASENAPDNSLTFTAPYTGRYYIAFDTDANCTNSGNTDIGNVSVQLNGSAVCLVPPSPPANDNCAGAINIPFSSPGTCTTVRGTTVGATQSAEPTTVCSATWFDDDVFYSFTTPAVLNDTTFVNFVPVAGSIVQNVGMAVYPSCGAGETALYCFSGGESFIALASNALLPNTTYIVRIWAAGVGSTTQGEFDICVTGFDIATGLNNPNFNAKNIRIAPNPASNYMNIQSSVDLGNTTVQIIDMNGKIVSEQKRQFEINTSYTHTLSLQRGNYTIRLISDNGVYTQKLIIQ